MFESDFGPYSILLLYCQSTVSFNLYFCLLLLGMPINTRDLISRAILMESRVSQRLITLQQIIQGQLSYPTTVIAVKHGCHIL